MATNYPTQIDTDIEIKTIRNNVTEIGAEVINAIKSATIAIEKYVGTSTGSTLSLTARLNMVIDNDGRLRQSAIETAGFITGPITNSDVDANAGIAESKLSLNHTTNALQDQIDVLRSQSDANTSQVLATATTVAAHISSSAVGAHLAINISYDPTSNTYYLTPSADPYFDDDDDDVQVAIDRLTEVLRMHKEAATTSTVPFGEHYAAAIYFDNDEVEDLTEHENVQEALEDAFDLYNQNMIVHRDEMHANGIIRNIHNIMSEATGYLLEDGIGITFNHGSSIVTAAGITLITDNVSSGDTIIISGSTSDDGTYQINDVLSNTQLQIVGTFKADDGGGATADIRGTSFEGGSPVEWSCNCLNCTEHTEYNATASYEVFVSHPAAAVVLTDEIDLLALAAEIWNGGGAIKRYFGVEYNGTTFGTVDLLAPAVAPAVNGYIDGTSYASLIQTMTTRNIVRAINRSAVDNHRPFHAFIKDENQIAIAHDFAEVDTTDPTSTTLNDTIRVLNGATGANDFDDITMLGFTGTAGVNTGPYVFPNYSNYYYVNGVRSRDLRVVTKNGSARRCLVDVDGATLDNFRLSGGTASSPANFELREGDVVRLEGTNAGVNNRAYTINSVGAANVTLKVTTGEVETDVWMTAYRNTVSVNHDTLPTKPTLYRVAVDEEGNVFKHRRFDYSPAASITDGFKIINCSRTIPGSATGIARTLNAHVTNMVEELIGSGNEYDPADYNSLYHDDDAQTNLTLQFDNGETIQIDDFNIIDTNPATIYGLKDNRQTFRLWSDNHVDWIDVEIDYTEFYNAIAAMGAQEAVTLTFYEELDEEKNLMLGSCLYTNTDAPANDQARFSSIVDERYFGTLGDKNVRSDFKQNTWEANSGIGNYILRGLLLTVNSNNLMWSGGSAFIGGHRIDFAEGTILNTELSTAANDAFGYGVYAMECGEVEIHRIADGRPEAEHVIIGYVYFDGTNFDADYVYHGPDFTNLNEKLVITVSNDPKRGMFTNIEQAIDYAAYIIGIRDSYHDKILHDTTRYGATIYIKNGTYFLDSAMILVDKVNLIGDGHPILRASDKLSGGDAVNYMFNCAGDNLIQGIKFSNELNAATADINQGYIRIYGNDVVIDDCEFLFTSSDIESAIYASSAADRITVRSCYFSLKDRAIHCTGGDEVVIFGNTIINNNSNTNAAIEIANGQNIKICNNIITSSSGADNIVCTGTGSSVEYVLIEGNTLTASSAYNICLTDADYIDITNNIFDTSAGISIENSENAAHGGYGIIDNAFVSCTTSVYIALSGVGGSCAINGLLIDNCSLTASDTSDIYVYATQAAALNYFKLTNSVLSSTGTENIEMEHGGAGDLTVSDFNISGCTIVNDNDEQNIHVAITTVNKLSVTNNYITTGENIDISVTNLNNTRIIGNYINNFHTSSDFHNIDFNASDCNSASIIDNTLGNVASSAIYIEDASNVDIINNLMEDNEIVIPPAIGTSTAPMVDVDGDNLKIANNNIYSWAECISIVGDYDNIQIESNYMYTVTADEYQIEINGDCTMILINGNICSNYSTSGNTLGNILLTGEIDYVTIADNVLYAKGDATALSFPPNVKIAPTGAGDGMRYFVISGNTMYNYDDPNITLTTATAEDITDIIMSNNVLQGGAGCIIIDDSGFAASNITNIVMIGNNFEQIGGTTAIAIDNTATVTGIVISDNTFDTGWTDYIGGALITGAGTQFMDTLRVANNIPPAVDWTFRSGTEALTLGGAVPPTGGGGEIWIDAAIPGAGANILLDDSIDWRDRYIVCNVLLGAATENPGGVGDANFIGWQVEEAGANNAMYNVGAMYTQDGCAPGGLPHIIALDGGADFLYIYVDENSPYGLRIENTAGGATALVYIMIHVSYSPKQGQY